MYFPGAEEASVGSFVIGEATVCGGTPYISECYYLNQEDFKWTQTSSMTEARSYAASESALNLPKERFAHNMVSMDSNRAMLLGGQYATVDTLIFDMSDESLKTDHHYQGWTSYFSEWHKNGYCCWWIN